MNGRGALARKNLQKVLAGHEQCPAIPDPALPYLRSIIPAFLHLPSTSIHFPMLSRFLPILVLVSAGVALAQQPAIQTSRQSAQILPLPKSDDAFHFIVYGDRTGGPPEGLQVLAQAVKDTNLLDPDLVMTVGDLINGYSGQSDWEAMTKDYRDIMQGLKMPWFPVAGNHDIYWRGPGRPVTEHEVNYEKHFAPLWYWFEHKKCAFIVLFSDEGDGTDAARDFTSPPQQSISPAQKKWLEETLQKTGQLKHAFVFLHHPRWVKATYPGSRWDEVHDLLKASANVRAVFAGHVHRMRYDGNRDGIDYITLATTGGSMPGHYPEAGYVHHMNLVSVRPEGIKVSTIPVGTVLDPKNYTPELIAEVESLRALPLNLTHAPIAIDARGRGAGLVEFKVTNPAKGDLDITVLPTGHPGEWISTNDELKFMIKSGETKQGSFSMIRVQEGFTGVFSVPSVEFRVDLIRDNARIPLPPRKIDLPVTLRSLPEDFFKASPQRVLRLDGKSAVRVEMGNNRLPDGPFTVEARVLPATDKTNGDILSKAEQSEFALNMASNVPGFHAFIDGRYTSAIAAEALPAGKWAHVAGVYDGKSLTLYVNGKPAASVPAAGKRTVNPLPLYIGANPDARSAPTQFLTGVLDEARLSSTARYTGEFAPEAIHTRDDATVYLFHCDEALGPFLPSDSAGSSYGTFTGKPELISP